MEPSSISIINKNNGSLTGENANALPIKLVEGNLRIKFFVYGFLAAIVFFAVLIFIAKKQVTVVDVSGKSADYTEYNLN